MRFWRSFSVTSLLLGILVSCDTTQGERSREASSESDPEKIKLREEVQDLKGRLISAEFDARELRIYNESYEEQIAALNAMNEALRNLNSALEAKVAFNDSIRELPQPDTHEVPEQKTWEVMSDEEKLAAYRASGIEGIAPAEAQKIIAKADLEPEFLRLSRLEREAAGYLGVDLFSRSVTAMPTKVRDEILASAKREHPGSWSRMADEINEQSAAWGTIDGWRKQGLPGLNRNETIQVLDSVLDRYPSDWKMAVFSVDSEAKKLKQR